MCSHTLLPTAGTVPSSPFHSQSHIKIARKKETYLYGLSDLIQHKLFCCPFFHIKSLYASFSMLYGSIFGCHYRPLEPERFIRKISLFLTVWEGVKSKAKEQCLVKISVR